MVDKKLLDLIVKQAALEESDTVLEIGSGEGALTELMVDKVEQLICVEKDDSLPIIKGVTYFQKDIFEIIDTLKFNAVVSNLPYHISEPLFKKLLYKKPEKIIVVVGKKFAEKLLAETIIGCVVRDVYSVKIIKDIHPVSFNPQPKVMSALVSLKLKSPQGLMGNFFEYEKTKVKNYLEKIFEGKLTKREVKDKLLELNLSFANKRLYELSTEEFLVLLSSLKNKILG